MIRVASTRTILDEPNLVDGVPIWMMGSAKSFIRRFTTVHKGRDRKNNEVIIGADTDTIHAIERYLQIQLPEDDEDEFELQNGLLYYARDETKCLDVLEATLATCHPANIPQMLLIINTIFIESGSKWIAKLQDEKIVLEERVNETTIEAFESTVNSSNNESGNFLKKSWGFAFNKSPNASEAYSCAIKSIEAAAWPVITPNNNKATLGHIIGEIKANPNKWHSSITEKETGISSSMLVQAMQLVWEGQTDRHGSAKPVTVTQEAAEQAVFTAVMICAYFNRNYIT